MPNSLAQYLNMELKGIIASVEVFQGTAKETGSPYYAIDLKFINGYSKRLFLKQDEQFAWVNAIEQLQVSNQMDAEL